MGKRSVLTAFLICSALVRLDAGSTAKPDTATILNDLNVKLEEATTPEDSIRILENISDLKDVPERVEILKNICSIASRIDDVPKMCDAIRKQANLSMKNDSTLLNLLDITLKLPKSQDRDETETFIRMMRTVQKLRYGSALDKQTRLNEMLERLSVNPPSDLYSHIVLLHAVCAYISDTAQGELLSKYMDYLGELIEQLPSEAYSIRNMYYIQAALAYSENDEPEKSIQADTHMLELIDSLESKYRKEGRMYRDFDANRFVIYTRILSNHESLTGVDVEEYYKKAMNIVKTNPRARVTYNNSPLIDIYYSIFNKNYPKALNLLKENVNKEYNKPKKRVLLKYMIQAAKEVGDEQTLLKASTEYNDILEGHLDSKYRERYKELQILYDMYKIKNEYMLLQESKHQSENKLHRNIIIISCVSCIVLATLIVVLLFLYRKSKHLSKILAESNAALKLEGDNLRRIKAESIRTRDQALKANNLKTDFIKNMSREVNVPLQAITEYSGLIVDCAESSQKKYLERFSKIVELNSELLSTMVNDMLSLADLDNAASPVAINKKVVTLYNICNMAVETTRHRVNEGVEMSFVPGDQKDISIYTDSQRIMQILINLLLNAAKFTKEGHINLIAKQSDDKSSVLFIVEDTGIGIPAEMKELIFERFYKLSPESQGAGLGLTISRILAKLLGGTLELDTSYRGGARFILRIPLS